MKNTDYIIMHIIALHYAELNNTFSNENAIKFVLFHRIKSLEIWLRKEQVTDKNIFFQKQVKARSHRQNVAGAFLERWGEGAEFWQRSSPRTKWQTKSKTRALPSRRTAEAGVALALV